MKLASIGQRNEQVEYKGKDAKDKDAGERWGNKQQNGQRLAAPRPADHLVPPFAMQN